MPRAKKEGTLTGSKHFKKPDTGLSDETKAKLETARASTDGVSVAERLKQKFDNARATVHTVSNAVNTVGNGVRAVAKDVKQVRRAFSNGSSLVTDDSETSFKQATEIGSNYGVEPIDVKSMLGTDPYKADGDIPEMDAKEANQHKLKIQKQNNALEVRHEKIKQGRKIAQLARENIQLIGDFVDLHTAKIEVSSKVINNQIANTNYQINQSRLEQTEELLIQQQISTQGTLNLTEGIREEWELKLEKQQAKNDRLKIEIQGAVAENEQKREELEARLFNTNYYQ